MISIGIDIGGTGIQAGVVDQDGRILHKGSFPTGVGRPYQEIIRDMADVTIKTVADAGFTTKDIGWVGIGIPGLADQKTGDVIFCTNMGWRDIPLRTEFQRHLDVPVYIDNDASVAGLAESVAGVSAGTSSSVFLTLGTGVGGGIIINGKVWSGHHGVGSEVGHMILEADGVPCTCGNLGCVERYCSATALIRMAKEMLPNYPDSVLWQMCDNDPDTINAKMVIDASREGDTVGEKVFRRYVKYLGQTIGTIINFFDPEVIVLGGGVSRAGTYLLEAVRAEVHRTVIFKTQPYSRIELALLGPDAGIIGAAMLGR